MFSQGDINEDKTKAPQDATPLNFNLNTIPAVCSPAKDPSVALEDYLKQVK